MTIPVQPCEKSKAEKPSCDGRPMKSTIVVKANMTFHSSGTASGNVEMINTQNSTIESAAHTQDPMMTNFMAMIMSL